MSNEWLLDDGRPTNKELFDEVLASPPISVDDLVQALDRDAKPLVDAFAMQLKRQEGLRDDVLVKTTP